jgi:oligoendopeptidase F
MPDRTRSAPTPSAPTPSDAVPPRWDTSSLFPSPGSREFQSSHEALVADLARLTALYDRHDVRARDGGADRPADAGEVAAFEEVVAATNDLLERVRLVGAYLHAFTTTDATDDEAAGLQVQLQTELTDLVRLTKRFDAWVASLGPDELVARSAVAAEHRFPLERSTRAAAHQMSEVEESLAADLRLSGSLAWSRLHRDITSRLTADVEQIDGTVRTLPMSVVRGMATHPEPVVRRASYEAEQRAWKTVSVALAAAINGAKGEAVILNRRRGWNDALEPSLLANAVDRQTLEAMHTAVTESLPDFRRYLRAKALLLGHDGALPWWDLLAPVGHPGASAFSWDDALQRVDQSFGSYSASLAGLVRRATTERWIDAEPREGKVGGAFCMPVRDSESRVLLNFDGSFDSVQTLAHELGHAYHNSNLAGRSPLQRQTPMALAETASIFCETIVVEQGLAGAEPAERLVLLDTDLQGATQVVVDIHSRFLFETELCRKREQRTLSVDELSSLMLDCQRAAYGDVVEPLHPWMWAVKAHYFTAFYNWPYTFGLLFGIGLYARYRTAPDEFRSGYDDLLASTGLGDAATLAARFGIDVRSPEFWSTSLDVLRGRIEEVERMAGGTVDHPVDREAGPDER